MKRLLAIFIIITIVLFSCKKNESTPPPLIAPTVTTAILTNITTSGATSGGTIVSDGGATVTQSGIVWSKTNATPMLAADSVIAGTTSTGTFTTNITGLDFNKTYYIRAYATNSVGTGYGNVLTLNTTNDTSKVRFMYNEQEVVYGIIISPTTGKKWLDRNMGAKRVATAFDDYQAYGDFFQWGRLADGHQLMNWISLTVGTPVNAGITTTLATSDNPSHNNFITMATPTGPSKGDWRDDNNANRWAIVPQGVCPTGWHVPTESEWGGEISTSMGGTASSGGITNRDDAYSLIKLTSAGYRWGYSSSAGQFNRIGNQGFYWSSTRSGNYSIYSHVASSYAETFFDANSEGFCVRCMKN